LDPREIKKYAKRCTISDAPESEGQVDYIAALLETDNSKLPRRLYEAIAAIEQRLLSPVEPGREEDQAIKQAQKVIAIIRAEKLDRGSAKPDR
jgi:hypothetical protein